MLGATLSMYRLICNWSTKFLALKEQIRRRYTRGGFETVQISPSVYFNLYKMRLSLMYYQVLRPVSILSL